MHGLLQQVEYNTGMVTLNIIIDKLRSLAPESDAMSGDPVGLLIGSYNERPINRIGVCLDATLDVVTKAVDAGIELIICHHPLIFQPIKRLDTENSGISAVVAKLIKADVNLYAMHTNWDRAHGGINGTLARLLELQDIHHVLENGHMSLHRFGELASPMALSEFCAFVAKTLNCSGTNTLRVNTIDPNKMITSVAVCGGAGGSLLDDVIQAGADAFVTADIRHHEFVEASARGIALIDAGHYATESPGMKELALVLPEQISGVDIVWLEG